MTNDRTPIGSRYHLSGCDLPDDHPGQCPIRERTDPPTNRTADDLHEAIRFVLDAAEKICALVDQSLLYPGESINTKPMRKALLDVRASYLTYLYIRDNQETSP